MKGNLAHEIVSDAQFYDYENIGINLKEAKGVEREWSRSDVQKLFTFTLVESCVRNQIMIARWETSCVLFQL